MTEAKSGVKSYIKAEEVMIAKSKEDHIIGGLVKGSSRKGSWVGGRSISKNESFQPHDKQGSV